MWVLDPIDGTFNYAAGSPMAAMLLGLLWEGEPVLGLTWLPFVGRVITPCDGDGVPFSPDNVADCQHETRALVLAWAGFGLTLAYGPVAPRTVDPHNPKRWAAGDVFSS